MLRNGKIAIATCSKTIKLPISHILGLARTVYTNSSEPHSFRDAFDHWLLTELLASIGSYNRL